MKLPFSVICETLLEHLSVEPVYLQYSEAETEVIGIGSLRDKLFSDEYIYLLCGNAPAVYPANCIIIGGGGCLSALPEHINSLVLPESVDMLCVNDAMHRVFAFFGQWQDELLDKIMRGADWYSLLDTAHRLLKNPMIIYNPGMKLLAYTKSDGSDDKLWADAVASGTPAIETSQESDELLKYVRRFETDNRPFKHQGINMSDPFYSCNIVVKSQRGGMVTLVERNHKISRGEIELLRKFCELLALKIQTEHDFNISREASFRQLMLDLLNGCIPDHRRLRTRLMAAGWNVQKYFVILQFSSSISYMSELKWKNAVESFDRLGLDAICCLINQTDTKLCALCTLKGPERIGLLKTKLLDFCAASHLCCGMSDVFEELLLVPRYWAQTCSALSFGTGVLTEFDLVRRKTLIEHLRDHPHRENLLSPCVTLLREHDEREGTEYCRTLKTLCDCAFRQSEAAGRLNIHRTTLSYRLQKITELTGLGLDDCEELLFAWLSLEMM